MDSLRWVLLVIGIVLVGGIYAVSVLQKRRLSDSDAGGIDQDDPWQDDLPSLDQLEAARAEHAAEGTDLPPLDDEVKEEILAADLEREARQRERELAELGIDTSEVDTGIAREDDDHEPRLGAFAADDDGDSPVEPAVHPRETAVEDERPEPRLQQSDPEPEPATQKAPEEPAAEPPVQQSSLFSDKREEPSPEELAPEEPAAAEQADSGDERPATSADEEARMVERAARQRVEEAAQRHAKPAEDTAAVGTRAGQSAARASAENRDTRSSQSSQETSGQKAAPKEGGGRRRHNEEVVVLYLKARDSIGLYGPEVTECLESMGFRFGEMDIYHYHSGGQRIVSVANIKKPGTFDPENMAGVTTPGLALFLQLRPKSDFGFSEEVLIKSAKYMANRLKGTVLDEQRKPLDARGEQALRMRIQSIRRKLQPPDDAR